MNTEIPAGVDKAAFLAWVQTRERQRFELVEGEVIEAEPHTLGHALIATNLARTLDRVLHQKGWYTLLSFGVETGPTTIRDPDVLVARGGKATDVMLRR